MYISARFAALSRKFWFNFRRLSSRLGNLEIAVFSSDKRDSSEEGKQKENIFSSFGSQITPTIADRKNQKSRSLIFNFPAKGTKLRDIDWNLRDKVANVSPSRIAIVLAMIG